MRRCFKLRLFRPLLARAHPSREALPGEFIRALFRVGYISAVKNLLVFLLVLATAGLYFHDKQQTADLAQSQQDNATLTQQLADKDAALTKLQQSAARPTQPYAAALTRPAASAAALNQSNSWSLQGSSLDRGAYKDGH